MLIMKSICRHKRGITKQGNKSKGTQATIKSILAIDVAISSSGKQLIKQWTLSSETTADTK